MRILMCALSGSCGQPAYSSPDLGIESDCQRCSSRTSSTTVQSQPHRDAGERRPRQPALNSDVAMNLVFFFSRSSGFDIVRCTVSDRTPPPSGGEAMAVAGARAADTGSPAFHRVSVNDAQSHPASKDHSKDVICRSGGQSQLHTSTTRGVVRRSRAKTSISAKR